MRFRRLTSDELLALETEFKQFLIIHELYDEEWRTLAKQSPEKADEFIGLFSDIVFEKIFNELDYLVHFSHQVVSFFDVRNNPMTAYHIRSTSDLFLQNETLLAEAVSQKLDELSFFIGKKNVEKTKAEEVWDLIQKGSEKCDESYFNYYVNLFQAK